MNDFDWDVLQKKRIANNARRMKRGSKSKKCALPSDRMTPAEWKRRNGEVNTYTLNRPMSWDDFKNMPLDLQQSYIDIVQSRFGTSVNIIGKELFGLGNGSLWGHLRRNHLKCKNFGKGHQLSYQERLLWDNWRLGHPTDTSVEAVTEQGEAHTKERVSDREEMLEMLTRAEGVPALDELREDADEVVDTAPETVAEPDEEDYKQDFHSHGKPFEIPVAVAQERAEQVAEDAKVHLTDLTATFKGEFDTGKFVQWIAKLPMPEGLVKIRVEVEAL